MGVLDLEERELGLGLVDLPDVQGLVVLDTLLHLVRPEALRRAPDNRSWGNFIYHQ